MRLTESVRQFLEHLEVEEGKSRLTLRSYEHYLQTFIAFCDGEKVTEPGQVTQEVVRLYRLWLNRPQKKAKQPGYLERSKKTQNYYLIALRSYLKYLSGRDIDSLPPEKIPLARVEEREITFLEPEEIVQIISQAKTSTVQGCRDRALLEMLFSTGLRISELINLNRDNVNLDSGEFSVRGKRGKIRLVFLSPEATEAIKSYLRRRSDEDPALFVRTQANQHGKSEEPSNSQPESNNVIASPNGAQQSGHEETLRLTPRTVQRLVHKYAREAGLAKKVTPHVFRHSFATDLLQNGADLRSVQELLGHSSVTTTQIYTHVTNPQLRDIHKAFHARRRAEEATSSLRAPEERGNPAVAPSSSGVIPDPDPGSSAFIPTNAEESINQPAPEEEPKTDD